jgi:hypothetical protein
MKLYKIYENLLTESKISGCLTKYGNQLFAQQLGGTEVNTDIENNHLDLIQKYTDDEFGSELNNDTVEALNSLINCVKQYPEVLEPNNVNVYRGERIKLSYFIENNILIPLKTPIKHTFNAKNPFQSWTENLEVAQSFSNAFDDVNDKMWENFTKEFKMVYNKGEKVENDFYLNKVLKKYMDLKIPVIVSIKATSETFLFKADVMNKISSMDVPEYEVIRIGNSPISVDMNLSNVLNLYSVKALNLINDILEYGI